MRGLKNAEILQYKKYMVTDQHPDGTVMNKGSMQLSACAVMLSNSPAYEISIILFIYYFMKGKLAKLCPNMYVPGLHRFYAAFT